MMIRYYISGVALVACILLNVPGTVAQQRDTLRQEVEVVKSYTPMTIDAEKINEAPVIRDDARKKPDFTYSIDSKPVFSALPVNNLQAATIVGKPEEKPGYGLVRAGVGNYNKPYGELFFNNTKNKNSVFGLHAKHLSSHGKLNLRNGDRVSAPFSENEAEMFLKHMFRKSTLSVNLGIDHDGFRYYGYPGTTPADSIPWFLKNESQNYTYQGHKQAFTRGGIDINLQNVFATKEDPSAGFDFKYARFGNKTGQREDFARFDMNFHRPQRGFGLMVDGGVEYSRTTGVYPVVLDLLPLPVTRSQTWISFRPGIYLGNETINLRAGFKSWLVAGLTDKATFKVSPDIRFNFSPVKEIINVFAGADGQYHHNHYSAIAYDNPFIVPSLSVKNHHEVFKIYGGFDGKISSRTNFKIQVDHSKIDGQPLYYLQGFRLTTLESMTMPRFADNTFRVLYQDMKKTRFNGEVTYYAGDKLNILVSANIYKYTMLQGKDSSVPKQEYPWNLPSFDATVTLNYAVSDRLSVAADVYAIGARRGMIFRTDLDPAEYYTWETMLSLSSASPDTYKLNPVFDINLRGNYAITRKLTAFGQVNNFGMQKYEKWLGYPAQTFNFLAGVSFSF
ncbi:MAG: hypothetical protein KA780_03415 [Prolixibacteraceae bacterium]|nr:hypothetical protein [Prolixibacteraceae bacterium]